MHEYSLWCAIANVSLLIALSAIQWFRYQRPVAVLLSALELTAYLSAIYLLIFSINMGLESTISASPSFGTVAIVASTALSFSVMVSLLTLRTYALSQISLTDGLMAGLHAVAIMASAVRSDITAVDAAKASASLAILAVASMARQNACNAEDIRQEQTERSESRGEQAEYLRRAEESHRRARELSHNLNNHIIGMDRLLAEGRYGELSEYLKGLSDKMQQSMMPVHTGNIVMDAVLADKYGLALSRGISMEFDLASFGSFRIDADDLCSIVGNLLDNAIEACCRHKGVRDPWIRVRACPVGTAVAFSVSNPVSEPPRVSNGLPVTSKADGVSHGHGLRNVRRVADRYGGEMTWGCESGIFTITVQLLHGSARL